MNAYSTIWNFRYHNKKNADPLEELIEKYRLIINYDMDYPTCLTSQKVAIIDLALTSPILYPFRVWEILEEYSLILDYELLLLKYENIKNHVLGV